MRPAAPPRRTRAAVALVSVLALVAAACSGDDGGGSDATGGTVAALTEREPVDEAELGPLAVSTEGMAGPGTPLGGGLEVPEGAVLLGVPFPDLVGDGYRALLLVPGDPVGVFSALAEQAGGLGMDADDGGCVTTAEGLGCAGRFVDAADGESLTLNQVRRVGEGGVVSGLGLLYRPPGTEDEGVDPGTATPTDPVPPVFLPEDPVEPPGAEDLVVAVRDPGEPERALEEGSRLVGLPGPCTCAGPGWSFVVELTGVERDVVAAYARQMSDLGDVPDISDELGDDLTLLGVRVGEGRPVAEIRAVVPDSGPAYAIVTLLGA